MQVCTLQAVTISDREGQGEPSHVSSTSDPALLKTGAKSAWHIYYLTLITVLFSQQNALIQHHLCTFSAQLGALKSVGELRAARRDGTNLHSRGQATFPHPKPLFQCYVVPQRSKTSISSPCLEHPASPACPLAAGQAALLNYPHTDG